MEIDELTVSEIELTHKEEARLKEKKVEAKAVKDEADVLFCNSKWGLTAENYCSAIEKDGKDAALYANRVACS